MYCQFLTLGEKSECVFDIFSRLQKICFYKIHPCIFQSNFSKGCCPQSGLKELFFIFWQSWPYENGTQHMKPQAIWSENLGLMRMMPIDIETITLRIAVVEVKKKLQIIIFKNVFLRVIYI